MWLRAIMALSLLVVVVGCGDGSADRAPDDSAAPATTLVARAILPASARQAGPVSGRSISADNGVRPPFADQPVAGFSAILNAGDGEYWAMPDNGYGAKDNSADFLLGLYRIRPRFRTVRGGDGTIDVRAFMSLQDPDRRISYALTRPDRRLTGADFDPESVRRANDGSFWFGDEFGPFLLHTDATGKVLAAPFALPAQRSPQNPYLTKSDGWTIASSRGFEAMASAIDGTRLYPMLEGARRDENDRRRRIIMEFDLRKQRYSRRTWSYRTDARFPDALISDMTALSAQRFVLIERDDEQGAAARHKKIYLIDLRRRNADGHLVKRLVVDLLAIGDPHGISSPPRRGEYGVGRRFSFALRSVESLEVLTRNRLLLANDNNYPTNDGRWSARDRPDDTELIIVHAPLTDAATAREAHR